MILTNAHIGTDMELGATLAHYNVTGYYSLPAKLFHAEASSR
tara:strand:+ start:248 stop:373 length:126 start_codon:yes stop_codon:yes gene_type:complete